MDCFPLSIPHLIVSSAQTIKNDLELHVLTPFGHVDISFSVPPPPEDEKACLDILVEGDTASWMLERPLPQSFRKTIIGFVGRIALWHSGWPEDRPYELHIRFANESGDIHLKGRLMPCAFAIAGG